MKQSPGKLVAENRRARFDYEIIETLTAGVELLGHEVKSVKGGQMGLHGSYVVVQKNEAWLLNAQIPPYQPKNTPENYDPARTRRLLLRTTEVAELAGRAKEKYTLIPLKAELQHGLVKIVIGIARPRKTHDKRDYIKKREAQKEMRI